MNHTSFGSVSSPLVNPAIDIYPVLNGIRTEVRFGMASRNCSGLGICSVEATSRTPSMVGSCDRAIAYLTCDSFGQTCFSFLKATVCLKAAKKQFHRGAFKVREDFELPQEVVRYFGINNGFIRRGNYPIIETEKFWQVNFSQH